MKTARLGTDLTRPGFKHDRSYRVVLENIKEEMKKRGMDCPDDADALAPAFAASVAVARRPIVPPVKPLPRTSGGSMRG